MPRVFVYKTGDQALFSEDELSKTLRGERPTHAVLEGYDIQEARGAYFCGFRPFIYQIRGKMVDGEVFELNQEQMEQIRGHLSFHKEDYLEKKVMIDGKETVTFVARPSSVRAEQRIESLIQNEEIRRSEAGYSHDSDDHVPVYLADLWVGNMKEQILLEERAKGD